MLEMLWIAVSEDIQAQKEACRDTLPSRCIKEHHARCIKGHHDEGHHAAPQNLKVVTSKKEPHPERAHTPSERDAVVESLNKEGNQEGKVEGLSTNHHPPDGPSYAEACNIVSRYCDTFHWEKLTDEDFAAAVKAELGGSGAGRAVVNELALLRAKESANE
jgi:hypothetical protein